jgi:adenosine deaminase CECR1
MPTESDSKTSSDSQKPRGWFAKCGIPILYVSALSGRCSQLAIFCGESTNTHRSVRDRPGSSEGPNRPVMTKADSPKKRKRASSSSPGKRMAIQYSEPKAAEIPSLPLAVRGQFDAALGDSDKILDYTTEHAKLLQEESDDAWDLEARSQAQFMTGEEQDDEKKAARIVQAIREYERRVTFGNQASEAIPGPETLDMGGQFLTNKERINKKSILYRIAQKVPKGGLLHLHFNAELYPDLLLIRARSMKNMYVRSIRPLLEEVDFNDTEMVFNVLDSEKVTPNVNIFSDQYQGTATNWKTPEMKWKVWMPWDKFQAAFEKLQFAEKYREKDPMTKGNMAEATHCCSEPANYSLQPAEVWLKSKMQLSPEEAYGPTQTVNG